MAIPHLTYTAAWYVQNESTGVPEKTTPGPLPTDYIRVSDKHPYNTIDITYTNDIPLIYYEVRVTKIDEDFGIGKGTLLYPAGPNIAANSVNSFSIVISKTIPEFASDGDCRIGFYAKSSDSEGLWDVTYLLISSDDYLMTVTDKTDGIELLTDEPAPSK